LAQAAGTLFIKRGGNQAADLIEQIGKRIDSGSSVLIFPEGTTGDGYALRRFYPRLFAAVQANAGAVQPVAIRYGSNAEPDPVAPFIDNDSLAIHLLRVLRNPGIHVHIAFLPPIDPTGHDRRSMADVTRAAIAARLGLGEQPAQYVKLPRVQTASRTSASR
ncbi:MAG TPA: 1-acyl-sn-glycerol-3-phosphate acyltransferase, partial [Chromatiaceae bacterium]|nr:1-acyl-sn-glycerol-3-phosphate acyltransferase [Chromatiaceae bacterium]